MIIYQEDFEITILQKWKNQQGTLNDEFAEEQLQKMIDIYGPEDGKKWGDGPFSEICATCHKRLTVPFTFISKDRCFHPKCSIVFCGMIISEYIGFIGHQDKAMDFLHDLTEKIKQLEDEVA